MKPVCNDGSIDVIFCMSLIHHLDIDKVSGEMLRVLAPTGYIVLKEPIRLSKSYAAVCKLVPEHSHISDFEHPLTQGELATIMEPFTAEGLRYFRLPIVPIDHPMVASRQRGRLETLSLGAAKPAAHQSLRNLDRDEAAEACL